MRLVPVFTLETNNQTNNECLPKFVQTDNASSSIKTANYTIAQLFRSHAETKTKNQLHNKKKNVPPLAWEASFLPRKETIGMITIIIKILNLG